LRWPKWGLYYESAGNSGRAPDLPEVKELARLNHQWQVASSTEERARIWRRMLKIHADNVYTIGVVSGVLQPVVITNRLRNVPVEGIYNWDPGSYFGIYKPDTFWYAQAAGELSQ
jgi:peptide/nickel transport system substrate-binding protein